MWYTLVSYVLIKRSGGICSRGKLTIQTTEWPAELVPVIHSRCKLVRISDLSLLPTLNALHIHLENLGAQSLQHLGFHKWAAVHPPNREEPPSTEDPRRVNNTPVPFLD